MADEPKTEPKTISLDRVVDRFFGRLNIYKENGCLPDGFDPSMDMVYARDEDAMYVFKDGCYRMMDERVEFPDLLRRFLSEERKTDNFIHKLNPSGDKPLHLNYQINPSLLDNMLKMLRFSMPQGHTVDVLDSNWLTFSDGNAINLSTYELKPATRAMMSFFKVDFPSTIMDDPTVDAPRFKQFLDEILVVSAYDPTPNVSLIEYVQEVFGYCLMDTVRLHSCFFFYGSGQNGKSLLLSCLQGLFPQSLVSHVKVADISHNQFAASDLVGRKINLVNEEEAKSMRVDTFKNLIGGDEMTVERKFEARLKYVPKCKFLWATNEIPTFEKLDEAMKRRINIIPFYRKIPDELRDIDLKDKLDAERAGILKWAIEGAKRLRERGFKWSVPMDLETTLKAVASERFPAVRYFEDFYDVTGDEKDYVFNKPMYADYVAWCRENGNKPMSENNFGAQVLTLDKRIMGGDEKVQVMGIRARVRRGFRRKVDAPPFTNAPAEETLKEIAKSNHSFN